MQKQIDRNEKKERKKTKSTNQFGISKIFFFFSFFHSRMHSTTNSVNHTHYSLNNLKEIIKWPNRSRPQLANSVRRGLDLYIPMLHSHNNNICNFQSATTFTDISHCQDLVNQKALYEIQFECICSVAMWKVSNAHVTAAEN
jgi:hypothetical protein